MIKKIIGGVCSLIGIALLIAAFYVYKEDTKFMSEAETTTGTIVNIIQSRGTNDEIRHTVIVQFTVGGQTYDGELNYYNSGMFKGSQVPIYYKPSNPNDFRGGGGTVGAIILAIIGAVSMLIGVGFTVHSIFSSSKTKRIKGYNFTVKAEISGLSLDRTFSANNKHPFVLEAHYTNETDGVLYFFKSEHIWRDITPILKKQNMTTVSVYVNPDNYKEYFVDLQQIMKFIGN